jgi:hypothetical protein
MSNKKIEKSSNETRFDELFNVTDSINFKQYITEAISKLEKPILFKKFVEVVKSYEKNSGKKVYVGGFYEFWENVAGNTVNGFIYIEDKQNVNAIRIEDNYKEEED